MPSVNAAAFIEYSLTSGTIVTGTFTGTSLAQVIANVKAVANFKHIDTYMIITYNGQTVINPQPQINQGII